MFGRILVAIDGSEHARRALTVAVDLAQKYGATLCAVSVAHIPEFSDLRDEVNGALEDATKFFNRALEEAKRFAQEEGVEIETSVIPGHPADALVRFAEARGCDLIVMGARGLSTIQRYLMGSVSEATVRHAHCPVLVVKGK